MESDLRGKIQELLPKEAQLRVNMLALGIWCLFLEIKYFLLYILGKCGKTRVDRVFVDCKTVSFFARRSKIQARSSNGRLRRGNGLADGSEKEWELPFRSCPYDHFLFPVSHFMNALGFSISRQKERLFCSLFFWSQYF